jgi:hypothetical protein
MSHLPQIARCSLGCLLMPSSSHHFSSPFPSFPGFAKVDSKRLDIESLSCSPRPTWEREINSFMLLRYFRACRMRCRSRRHPTFPSATCHQCSGSLPHSHAHWPPSQGTRSRPQHPLAWSVGQWEFVGRPPLAWTAETDPGCVRSA